MNAPVHHRNGGFLIRELHASAHLRGTHVLKTGVGGTGVDVRGVFCRCGHRCSLDEGRAWDRGGRGTDHGRFIIVLPMSHDRERWARLGTSAPDGAPRRLFAGGARVGVAARSLGCVTGGGSGDGGGRGGLIRHTKPCL